MIDITRRSDTRVVHVGSVPIGGAHPVAIESMTNTDTRNIDATVAQINELHAAGCEIVRVSVPCLDSAAAIKQIKNKISIPLIADIHFDYRIALESIKSGVDKLRINPGNIGDESRVKQVVDAARQVGIPIRIGVNGGSLEKKLETKYGGVTAQALAESAFTHVKLLEKFDFENIVVSAKSSNVPLLIETNKLLAQYLKYPIHIGLTEAGTPYNGAIRSAVGLGVLLNMGIGNTIRISLSGSPLPEIQAAKVILSAAGLRKIGVTIVACPTCARSNIDIAGISLRLEEKLSNITQPLNIAVMGCAVNGPGEAREADIGIAGGNGEAILFKKGVPVRKISEVQLEEALLAGVHEILQEKQ